MTLFTTTEELTITVVPGLNLNGHRAVDNALASIPQPDKVSSEHPGAFP